MLRDFWTDFSKAVDGTKNLTIKQVIDALNEELGPHFFPSRSDGADPRTCPACGTGRLGLKLGKYGAFIGCSNYPSCRYTRRLEVPADGDDNGQAAIEGPKELGLDPQTALPVILRKGPYGHYVQLGNDAAEAEAEADGEAGKGKRKAKKRPKVKPKRVSLPRGVSPESMTLDLALKLLALPREIGLHPESGKPIVAGIGRFGPYIKHESTFKSVGSVEEVLTIGLNRAVDLLSQARSRGPIALRELGPHPADGQPVRILKGRYGPYIKHGAVNAPLPKGQEPEQVTFEAAVAALAERGAAGAGRAKKTGRARATKPRGKSKTAASSDAEQ